MFEKVRKFLKGKKTYLTATSAIIVTIVSWAEGQISDFAAVQYILQSLIAIFIRNAID